MPRVNKTTINDPRSASPIFEQSRPDELLRREQLTELASFLRACRERLQPEAVGLAVTKRRRARGLRRDEVASRAGVSVDWYIRIEQGRDVKPSVAVLDSLATALALNETETEHLHVLGGNGGRRRTEASDHLLGLSRFICGLAKAPAFVLDARWDVKLQNAASARMWGKWDELSEFHNNLLYRFFTDPVFTVQLEDWERHARLVVRQYRTVFARNMADPRFSVLIRALANVSPQFARWWAGTDVSGRDDGYKVFYHPKKGVLTFDYIVLKHAVSDGYEVVAFVPSQERVLRS
jgi:transcriptional regulator with XRE-family HTH domain